MQNIKILQPKNCNLADVKHEITQRANEIIDIATTYHHQSRAVTSG